jgi:hypothetical protein
VNPAPGLWRDPVLLTLYTYRGTGGIAWPAHSTLASRTGCCVRTVQRALAAAEELGLVTWAERRIRAGWRWLRASNIYRFIVPAGGVSAQGGPKPAHRGQVSTTGHRDREGESKFRKEALEMPEAGAARAALARVAAERAAKIFEKPVLRKCPSNGTFCRGR